MNQDVHMRGVAPNESIPSTDTIPGQTSRSKRTMSGTFSQAANPRGVTSRRADRGAFKVYREISGCSSTVRSIRVRWGSMYDALDASMSSHLTQDS